MGLESGIILMPIYIPKDTLTIEISAKSSNKTKIQDQV